MLRRCRWLDPRTSAEPPIQDSVHLPSSQLQERVFELPERGVPIWIADVGAEALEALSWLRENGRIGEVRQDFQYGSTGKGRLWSPNAFLEETLPRTNTTRGLDIACGSGRDAVFMASAGLHVTAVDHLLDALQFGRRLESSYLDDATEIEWVCADLDAFTCEKEFDILTCFYYLNRSFLAKARNLVSPGGHVVIETFTTIHRERFGKPRSEQYALQPGELPSLLQNFEVLHFDEGWRGSRHTARFWGQLR